MLYGLPCMTGLFAMWWPVGLQIPIFLNGIIGITQNLLFRQPWFRAICGIQPLGVMRSAQGPTKINRGPPVEEPAPKGFVGTVRRLHNDGLRQSRQKKRGKGSGGNVHLSTSRGRSEYALAWLAWSPLFLAIWNMAMYSLGSVLCKL